MRAFWRWWVCNVVHSWRHWTFTPVYRGYQVRCGKCGRKWMVLD